MIIRYFLDRYDNHSYIEYRHRECGLVLNLNGKKHATDVYGWQFVLHHCKEVTREDIEKSKLVGSTAWLR